jgi:hypothetical protein
MSHLLALPPELRLMIWHQLLPTGRTFVSPCSPVGSSVVNDRKHATFRPFKRRLNNLHVSNSFLICWTIFDEISNTFFNSNIFSFEIRANYNLEYHATRVRPQFRHIQLVDRLSYDLPVMNLRAFIASFENLRCVSIPVHPEPFPSQLFDLNLEQRCMSLRVTRDLVEALEVGDIKILRMVYRQPDMEWRQDPDSLLTVKLLRHLRPAEAYENPGMMSLWVETLSAWISSCHSKRAKLLKVIPKMEPTYRRKFLASYSDEHVDKSHQAIVLSMP